MNRIKELLQAKGMSQISCKRVQNAEPGSSVMPSAAEIIQISCKRVQNAEPGSSVMPSAAEIIQAELAHRLGKCFNTVTPYAANRVQPPIPVLYQIAGILDVDVRELLLPSKKHISTC